jgi:hypothetical protein
MHELWAALCGPFFAARYLIEAISIHPFGQTPIVTAGSGLIQYRGGPIRRIGPGECPVVPCRRETLARRFADDIDDAHRVDGTRDGKMVDRLEKVIDEQYNGEIAED